MDKPQRFQDLAQFVCAFHYWIFAEVEETFSPRIGIAVGIKPNGTVIRVTTIRRDDEQHCRNIGYSVLFDRLNGHEILLDRWSKIMKNSKSDRPDPNVYMHERTRDAIEDITVQEWEKKIDGTELENLKKIYSSANLTEFEKALFEIHQKEASADTRKLRKVQNIRNQIVQVTGRLRSLEKQLLALGGGDE